MTCNHCVMNVRNAIQGTKGVETVEVDLTRKLANIQGDFDLDDVIRAVENVGYQVVE
jgi:copper chaperone